MKQIIWLFLLANWGKTMGQEMLPLPPNAELGREYAQCLIPDSAHRSTYYSYIPAYSWDEFLLEKTPELKQFMLELPIFDTIILRIPVDKITRMANLPDEFGLIKEKTKVSESSFKWIHKKYIKECLSANPSDCFGLALIEIPEQYTLIQKLVIKSTAHQQRYDDKDTILFKQVIEIKPLKKIAFDVPPQYEKVFMKKNPYAAYTEWRQVLCADGERSRYEATLMIQEALKKRGYYNGKLDNIMGEKTKAALLRFQKDNNLPSGNLNYETLKALRVLDEEDD